MGKGKSNSYETTTTNYGFYFIFGLVTYFIWCDLSFFGELSAEKNTNLKFKNVTLISHKTIKLRMQDHFGHYIYLPFCTWANGVFHISEIPWMSPNVVTALHFFVAIICGRMFASASLFLRRIAVLLYEFRSMLDILDGVIYRAQSKSKDFISGWGTYGYMFDGLADTLGEYNIIFICLFVVSFFIYSILLLFFFAMFFVCWMSVLITCKLNIVWKLTTIWRRSLTLGFSLLLFLIVLSLYLIKP